MAESHDGPTGAYAGAEAAGAQLTEGITHDGASDTTSNHDDMGYKGKGKPSRKANEGHNNPGY